MNFEIRGDEMDDDELFDDQEVIGMEDEVE